MKRIIIGITILLFLVGCDVNGEIPYRGEPCEEVDYDEFVADMTNVSDYIRADKSWRKFSSDNQLKGYCKNGTRIGGLR